MTAARIKADGFGAAQIDYWMKAKPRSGAVPRCNLLDALMSRMNGK